MPSIDKFEDIEAWKLSRNICKKVYMITRRDDFARDYKLVRQIRGSSGSIMDNIAEGFGRQGRAEFIQFLAYSMGSAAECQSQLYRAMDAGYITKSEMESLYEEINSTSKMINGLIQYLKTSDYRGSKFKR